MSDPSPETAAVDKLTLEILGFQREILAREEEISRLVDAFERPPVLSGSMQDGEGRRRIEQLERLIAAWDSLVARSRAMTKDDFSMVLALTRCVGDLLLKQVAGLDERWVVKLREYLAEQRSQIS